MEFSAQTGGAVSKGCLDHNYPEARDIHRESGLARSREIHPGQESRSPTLLERGCQARNHVTLEACKDMLQPERYLHQNRRCHERPVYRAVACMDTRARCQVFMLRALQAAKPKSKPRPTHKARWFNRVHSCCARKHDSHCGRQLSSQARSRSACSGFCPSAFSIVKPTKATAAHRQLRSQAIVGPPARSAFRPRRVLQIISA